MVSRSMVSPSPVIVKRRFTTWFPVVSNSTSFGPLNHIDTFEGRPASLPAHSLPPVLHLNSATVCEPLELVTCMEPPELSRAQVDLVSSFPSLCCHLPMSLSRLESSPANAEPANSSALKVTIETLINPPM